MVGSMKPLVMCSALLFCGCFYRLDTFPTLGEGDVTGVVVGVPPDSILGETRLAGARVRLLSSSVVRSTPDDGRFTLRNLPTGDYQLLVEFGRTADGRAQLAARTAFNMRERAGKRSALDLGTLRLSTPGRLRGRVTGTTDLPHTFLVLTDSGLAIPLLPDSTFDVAGVAPGTWKIAAAAPGVASAPMEVTVESGATTTVILELPVISDVVTLQGQVVLSPGDEAVPQLTLTNRVDGNVAHQGGVSSAFALPGLAAGLYAVRVELGCLLYTSDAADE